jgi:hypothetical protein
MIETELAFDKDGEPFAVPDTAAEWRLRRLRGGRGAPELVYGPDGTPLTLDISAGLDDLREAVDTSGRYRLEAIDKDGKTIPNVPPSYVQVTVTPRNATRTEAPLPPNLSATDHAIRELVRANVELVRTTTELAKAVATQQPDVLRAAAELLRAADGAGLPRRDPIVGDDDSDDDVEIDPTPAGPDWVSVAYEALATLKVVVAAATAKRHSPASTGAATTAAPSAPAATSDTASSVAPSDPTQRACTSAVSAPAPSPDVDPHVHLMAIQAQLTPAERAFVMGVFAKLSTEDRAQWADQLTRMSVTDAVTMIRTEIKDRKEKAS